MHLYHLIIVAYYRDLLQPLIEGEVSNTSDTIVYIPQKVRHKLDVEMK